MQNTSTTTEQVIKLRRKKCPSCKRMAMWDKTNTVSDGFCGWAYCEQYRRVCHTCCSEVYGNHNNYPEHLKKLEAMK